MSVSRYSVKEITVKELREAEWEILSDITVIVCPSILKYILDIQDQSVTIESVENQTMNINYGVTGIVKSMQRFDVSTISNIYDVAARLTSVILPDATNTSPITTTPY